MIPRGIDVRKLNIMVSELRKRGLWAERHAYSIRIIYSDLIVASLHLYPGFNEAVLRVYSGRVEVDEFVINTVREVINKHLPEFKLREIRMSRIEI